MAKRTPPYIIGNGKDTILELIKKLNHDPKRGYQHDNELSQIIIDEATHVILAENNLSTETILPLEKKIFLKETANMSTGGTAEDVTELVHPDIRLLAERIARITHLDVCGIDMIAKNISKPLTKNNGAILEVNAAPGFRMHLFPSEGQPRNVAKDFIDMLYPPPQNGRIPIVAVTGTNGKTTVVRLIAHLALHSDYNVGMCTTEGIYINGRSIYIGDCSGPDSAKMILKDPIVNFAVLECARGGILRSGLAFDKCDVSIVTNVSEDHLGLDDIDSLDKMAHVKSVLPQSTSEDGYAILNADDDLVYEMRNGLKCKIVLFSTQRSTRIIEHLNSGGLCCFINSHTFFIGENKKEIPLLDIASIPLTFSGQASFMVTNLLPIILVGWIYQFKDMLSMLINFFPTAKNLPGRMNLFKFQNCEVIVDYAHNPAAYQSLGSYLNHIDTNYKVAIIAGTGDRKDIDIKKLGIFAATMFNEIIIRHDRDSRGRTREEITQLLLQGIYSIDTKKPVKVISNEFEAVQYAISNAKSKTMIWYFPDKVLPAIKFLKKLPELISEE